MTLYLDFELIYVFGMSLNMVSELCYFFRMGTPKPDAFSLSIFLDKIFRSISVFRVEYVDKN